MEARSAGEPIVIRSRPVVLIDLDQRRKDSERMVKPNRGGFMKQIRTMQAVLAAVALACGTFGIDRVDERSRSFATTPPWRFHNFGVFRRRQRVTWIGPSCILRAGPILRRQIHGGYRRGVGAEQGRNGCRDSNRPGLHQASADRTDRPHR